MKKFLLTAVLGMFALAGFSQVKWDAKVGMSMTNLTGDMDGDMKIGYNVGVGMDYAFSEDWSLQSGLNFTGKGAKDEGVKVKMNYVELPILAAYKFALGENMKFVVNAGPYLAVGLGGKMSVDGADGEEGGDIKLFSKEDGAEEALMKRFDLGIQYGIGLEVGEHYLVNLTGQNGFINPLNDKVWGEASTKNMAFSISVGYRF
jgi:hypothetical protein